MLSSKVNKKKILIAHNFYQIPGGEDAVFENEVRLLKDHGFDVCIYTRSNSEIKNFSIFKKMLLPILTIFNPRTYFDIKRIIKQEGIDILHVHNTLSLISPSIFYAAKSCGIKSYMSIHNFRLICPGALLFRDGKVCKDCLNKGIKCSLKHKCYRNSFAATLTIVANMLFHKVTGIYKKINLICLTEFNKEMIINHFKADPVKVYVKPNFTKTYEISNEKAPFFLFAGRLEEAKGVIVLLEAFKIMGKRAPKLIIAGSGPLQDYCKKYIEDNRLSIELIGQIEKEKVIKLLSECIALIFPSLWYEGFPMIITESMSVGTPVIVSDIGNGASVITEGRSGYRFKTGDANSLASVVFHFLSSQSDLREGILEEFKEKYSEEKNFELLMEIYGLI